MLLIIHLTRLAKNVDNISMQLNETVARTYVYMQEDMMRVEMKCHDRILYIPESFLLENRM